MDYHGKGGPRNLLAAREWFLKAAQGGDASSQYNLGRMLCLGEGGPVDYQAAKSWFLKAANQGFSEAKYNIGVMYLNGQGTPVNYSEARRWFFAAAAEGNSDARRALQGGGQSRQSGTSNPFGSMLCNKMLGTSAWNIMSPCN